MINKISYTSLFLMIVFTSNIWAQWVFAPANASDTLEDALNKRYSPIAESGDLLDNLDKDSGWIWLKTHAEENSDLCYYLLNTGNLIVTIWLDGHIINKAGSPPPYWQPASVSPTVFCFATGGAEDPLFIKTYVHKGYSQTPRLSTSKNIRLIQARKNLIVWFNIGLPILTTIIALVLLAYHITVRRQSAVMPNLLIPYFNIFLILINLHNILILLPDTSKLIPWQYISLIPLLLLPVMTSLWRRTAVNYLGNEPLIISIADKFLCLIIIVWEFFKFTNLPIPGISTDIQNQIMRVEQPHMIYILFSAALGYGMWIYYSLVENSIYIKSLSILLTGITPPIVLASINGSMSGIGGDFMSYGIPASLATIVVILLFMKKKPPFVNVESKALPARFTSKQDANIRRLLYHSTIKKDKQFAKWDIACINMGWNHKTTSFYDYYTDQHKNLKGFACLYNKGNSIQAMILTFMVRRELIKIQNHEERNFSKIFQEIQKTIKPVAQKTPEGMQGLLANIEDDKIILFPVIESGLMIKKQDSKEVLSIKNMDEILRNPPIGSDNFTRQPLKSTSMRFKSGDTLVYYTNSIKRIESPTGEIWGIKKLAKIVKHAQNRTANFTMAKIVSELQSFSETEIPPEPLQILIIRRR